MRSTLCGACMEGLPYISNCRSFLSQSPPEPAPSPSSTTDGMSTFTNAILKHVNIFEGNNLTDIILSRAAHYQSTASQHRLNQPPKLNAGLQAASAAQIKNKLAVLKKQVKADTITVESALYYYPKSGGVAKKVSPLSPLHMNSSAHNFLMKAQLLPVLKKFFGSDPAKNILDNARSDLEMAWGGSPASNIGGLNTMNFEE